MSVAARELRQIIERAEAVIAEIDDGRADLKEIMAEAKGRGYDPKILKKVIALRKRDPEEVAEEEAILDLYRQALGLTEDQTLYDALEEDDGLI